MNIAVIPARGGSKRIPQKNIKKFCGKPMISYAISVAKKSGLFDRIVVSTDDELISEISRACGAEIPFCRPKNLADDQTGTVPVISHTIRSCLSQGWSVDFVCCIYPCSPLLQCADLEGAFMQIERSESGYCFPVAEYPSSIWRALRLSDDGKTRPVDPQYSSKCTQELEPTFYDAGQFYWAKADTWLAESDIHSNGVGYEIPNWRAVDIDTDSDWKRAELIYRASMLET
jgi:pseudaminic acid cytidylyltransferase